MPESAGSTRPRRGARQWEERIDRLLTVDRLRVYPVVLIAFWCLAFAALALVGPRHPLLPDFAARWTAGRLLLEGRADQLYDPGAQSALQATELGSTNLSWFVSPPFVAGAATPLSLLPYGWASAVWTLVSVAALAASALLLRPVAGRLLSSRTTLLVLASSAPILELLGSGQDTSFVLLALVGAWRALDAGRPLLGGFLASAGLIKPHLALLVPFVFLAYRSARALFAFVGGALALAGVSWWLVGGEGIRTWLTTPFTPLYVSEVTQGQTWKSVNLAAFLIGLPEHPSGWWLTLVTALVFVAVAGASAAVAARSPSVRGLVLWGLALLATAVASPHVMLYDLVVALPALIALHRVAWSTSTRALLAVTYVLLWLMSPLHSIVSVVSWPATLLALPWAALALTVLWARLARRLAADPAVASAQ